MRGTGRARSQSAPWNSQEAYGPEMAYAKAARKLGILLSSRSRGARKGYLVSFGRCVSPCQGQGVPAWLGSKAVGRGGVSANFILSERDALGLNANRSGGNMRGRAYHLIIAESTSPM